MAQGVAYGSVKHGCKRGNSMETVPTKSIISYETIVTFWMGS